MSRQIVEGKAPLIVGCTLTDLIDDIGHKGCEGMDIGTRSLLEQHEAIKRTWPTGNGKKDGELVRMAIEADLADSGGNVCLPIPAIGRLQ